SLTSATNPCDAGRGPIGDEEIKPLRPLPPRNDSWWHGYGGVGRRRHLSQRRRKLRDCGRLRDQVRGERRPSPGRPGLPRDVRGQPHVWGCPTRSAAFSPYPTHPQSVLRPIPPRPLLSSTGATSWCTTQTYKSRRVSVRARRLLTRRFCGEPSGTRTQDPLI